MDFELIERHPWATAGIVVVGGFVVYLIFRGGGSSAAAATSPNGVAYYPAPAGTDPTAAALQAQQDQISAALSATNIQAQTQLGLATISAGVSNTNVAAQQDVTNKQTAAQLALGIGTLQAQVDLAQIQANSELDAIRAIAAAYGGGSGSGSGGGISSIPTTPGGGTTNQIGPVVPVQIPSSFGAAPSPGITGLGTLDTGNYPVLAVGAPVLVNTPLEPAAAYTPVGAWPSASVVSSNTLQSVEQQNAGLESNNVNNFNACMASAALSQGKPNYDAIVGQCHAAYGL
jgi:hypothetical protein